MTFHVNNITKKEIWLDNNLENCYNEAEKCIYNLDELMQDANLNGEKEKAEWFKKLFVFYKRELIPILEETLDEDLQHSQLVKDNPDKDFKPFRTEIRQHQKLINQFLHRYDQVMKDYNNFINQLN